VRDVISGHVCNGIKIQEAIEKSKQSSRLLLTIAYNNDRLYYVPHNDDEELVIEDFMEIMKVFYGTEVSKHEIEVIDI
jgi:hypothetical protein